MFRKGIFLGGKKSRVGTSPPFKKDGTREGVRAMESYSPGFESHNKQVILSGKWDLFTPQISRHLEAMTVQGHGDINKMPSREPGMSSSNAVTPAASCRCHHPMAVLSIRQ